MREVITLECKQCKSRNYTTMKNKRKQTDRLERKKFCPRCRKHSLHREAK